MRSCFRLLSRQGTIQRQVLQAVASETHARQDSRDGFPQTLTSSEALQRNRDSTTSSFRQRNNRKNTSSSRDAATPPLFEMDASYIDPNFTLPRFFDELRLLKKDIGYASRDTRVDVRTKLEAYWTKHVHVAATMCKNARDVGFVAFYGLTDIQLRLPADLITPLVHIAVRDELTTSATDSTTTLRFLAREICRVLTSSESSADERALLSTEFVSFFVEHGMKQIDRLFHRSRRVGKGDDAIHALEFLCALANGHPKTASTALMLFDTIANDDLRMTSYVSAFGLLRIFISIIGQDDAADIFVSLMRRVKRKDDKLVNEFHFVKIVMTMARLPQGTLTNENLWNYIVQKACVFVSPTTSPEHRRLIVATIRRMLSERGLDRLLFPLSEELKQYPHLFEELISGPIPRVKFS